MTQETIVEVVERLAAESQETPFLTLVQDDKPDSVYTYSELLDIQKQWAVRFRKAGVRSGQTIVIILPHSEELYGSLGGAFLMGAVPALYAFPSPKLSDERYFDTLDKLIAQSGASLIVVYPELAPRLHRFLVAHKIAVPVVDSLGGVPAGEYSRGEMSSESVEVAFIQFSSGTTGVKKAVAVSHRALLWQIRAYAKAIELATSDVIVSWLPLYHDMGLIACFMLPWLTRTPVIAMSPFSWVKHPELLLDKIQRYRATLCWQPNFAYAHIADRVEKKFRHRWDLTSMRMFINCSEPVTALSHSRFVDVLSPSGIGTTRLGACYAMAENTFAVSNTPPGKPVTTLRLSALEFEQRHRVVLAREEGELARICVSSGVPLEGVVVGIYDTNGQALADGEVGEVAIQSPCLFEGYRNNTAESTSALRNGRYFTGDLGFLWEGEIYITGRKKDLIIVAGKNIYPQDIEEIVAQLDGVIPGRCVAFGVSDERRGTERIVVLAETAYIDFDSRSSLNAEIYSVLNATNDVTVDEVILVSPQWLVKSTSGKLSRGHNRKKYVDELCKVKSQNAEKVGEDDKLIGVLRRIVPAGARSLSLMEDTRLIAGGLLDSLNLTTLPSALEQEFQVVLQEDFINVLMADDRISTLRRLVSVSKKSQENGQNIPRNWNERAFANLTASEDRRRFLLAPQLADANRLGASSDPQLGLVSTPNYRSASLNTDDAGFRCTTKGGQVVGWDEFSRTNKSKGVVLGNSVAFGVGVSADSKTCASLLNDGENAVLWYNLALRRSNIVQEFAALKRFSACDPAHVVWLSGVNDLNFFLVDMVTAIKMTDVGGFRLNENTWSANYKKFKTRYAEVLREIDNYRRLHRIDLTFVLQPALNWVNKDLTPDEAILVDGFDCSFDMPLRRTLTVLITPLYRDYSLFLKNECASLGIRFADFNQLEGLRTPGSWIFMDRLHLSDGGHAAIAHALDPLVTVG